MDPQPANRAGATIAFVSASRLQYAMTNRAGLARSTFMIAIGIENSYPTIRLPDGRAKRVDSMALASGR
jgi:hypothetical protein